MRRNSKEWALLILLSVTILMYWGCEPAPVHNRFEPIPERQWSYNFKPSVQIQIGPEEKGKAYDLFINFRHSAQYRYSNLYVLLDLQFHQSDKDSTSVFQDRIELKLAEADGRWTGKNNGDLYTHSFLAKEAYVFPDTGSYTISIEQNMRDNPLNHAVAAGVRIEERKSPKN